MGTPEWSPVLIFNAFKIRVRFFIDVESWNSPDKAEKSNPERKYVSFMLILHPAVLLDFRSLILRSSRVELFFLKKSAKPKIGYFHLKVFCKENIVGFQVSVRETQFVNCFETFCNVEEENSRDFFVKRVVRY